MRLYYLAIIFCLCASCVSAAEKPNFIFILADDLAMGDIGAYGQKLIKTPNLDRMAKEGTRYLSAYAGTSVCAPSRSSFMTGFHMGHCPIRANREIKPEGQKPLPPNTVTISNLLKQAGYNTACMGKWGMGMFDTSGSPLTVGFDRFYGYNCQRHAHSYFPPYLYENDKRFSLPGNEGGKKTTYSDHYIQKDVISWVKSQSKDKPFFLFYPTVLPHGKYEIDDLGIYKDESWSEVEKTYAAMVTRLDKDVGELMDALVEMGMDKNTLIVFSGDNGSSFAPDSAVGKRFAQSLGMRGYKRGMYEGGLKQGAFAWWPGTVPAGRVTDGPWAFWDLLPTAVDLAGGTMPTDYKTDGKSLVSFLKGGEAPERECFYWELHEGGSKQAIRFGNWKAVKNSPDGEIELYDLAKDPGEMTNIAGQHAAEVAHAEALLKQERVDDPEWPMVGKKKK